MQFLYSNQASSPGNFVQPANLFLHKPLCVFVDPGPAAIVQRTLSVNLNPESESPIQTCCPVKTNWNFVILHNTLPWMMQKETLRLLTTAQLLASQTR